MPQEPGESNAQSFLGTNAASDYIGRGAKHGQIAAQCSAKHERVEKNKCFCRHGRGALRKSGLAGNAGAEQIIFQEWYHGCNQRYVGDKA